MLELCSNKQGSSLDSYRLARGQLNTEAGAGTIMLWLSMGAGVSEGLAQVLAWRELGQGVSSP